MWKKGPKEKEKILRRLTEKEIQEQLYGFRKREIVLPKAQPPAAADQAQIEQPPRQEPLKRKAKDTSKNPRFFWQIVLLIIFSILILASVRQIIKIISGSVASRPRVQVPRYRPQVKQLKMKGSARKSLRDNF